jgi:hypothetical protein
VSDAATPVRTAGSAGYALRAADVSFATPVAFPPHERCVEIGVDLGVAGGVSATVLGADLTHEYVAECVAGAGPAAARDLIDRAPSDPPSSVLPLLGMPTTGVDGGF